MRKRLPGIMLLFFAVTALAFAVPHAWAKGDPDTQTDEEAAAGDAHTAMLKAGQYERLDADLNQVQQEYEQGKRDDISLLHFFDPFNDAGLDPALEKNYDGWIAAYPKSYAARQARAFYFRRRADVMNNSADDPASLKPEQKAEIKRLTAAGLADSKSAAALTAKPILSYSNMIKIGWIAGDRALGKEMLDLAVKADPSNYVPRINYMPLLETRWGGSLEQMLAFREEVAKTLPPELLIGFDDLIEYERSWRDWQENETDTELLKNGQLKQLDERMNGFQKEYEDGKRNDVSIARLFGIFENPDPALESLYQAWVQGFPQSYAARTARSLYYLRLALKARGSAYMSETSKNEISGMERYMSLAMEDAKTAISLTPRPIQTYDTILTIAQFSGSHDMCRQMNDMAKEADPRNFIVRNQYMVTLEGRWGGSLEEMENFLKESREAGLTPRQIKDMEYAIVDEKLWLVRNIAERNETIGQFQTGF